MPTIKDADDASSVVPKLVTVIDACSVTIQVVPQVVLT